MLDILIKLFKWLFLLFLPFIALIRGAIYFHSEQHLGPWLSIGAGLGVTFIILVLYMTIVHGMYAPTLGSADAFRRRGFIALIVLLGFSFQGLFYISSANIKNASIAKELRQLHPIVRIAVSTVILIDKNLVITDATRKGSDYEKMGLPKNERSLHYKQKDGYAYAIDLRTNDRSYLRNVILQNYFRLMGFRTLKHSGTAPHLHVSLKPS